MISKTLISFFIFLFCSEFLYPQYTAYIKVAERNSVENIMRVSSGGYITLGDDFNHNPLITRWNEQFDTIWTIKLTDTNIVYSMSNIIEANDGSFYYMNTSQEHSGSTLIMKISSSGDFLWQKLYYNPLGTFHSNTISNAAGDDNGFVFGGSNCTSYNYVVKCNQDGAIEWQNQYKYPLSTGVVNCHSIVTNSSDYAVSGGYNINTLLTYKIDAIGNVVAQTAYTNTASQIVPRKMLALREKGGYAVLGNYNNVYNNRQFIVIYDSLLNIQSYNELVADVSYFSLLDFTAIDNGKQIVANGHVSDSTVYNSVIVNLSDSGFILWKVRSSGSATQGIASVLFSGIAYNGSTVVNCGSGFSDGGIIGIVDSMGNGLCNSVQFELNNAHKLLFKQSDSIYVVPLSLNIDSVNYAHTTGDNYYKDVYCEGWAAIEEPVTDKISVYPNPAYHWVNIDLENETVEQIQIFSVYGQLLFEISDSSQIDVNALYTGLYLLRVNNKYSTSFIVE